RDRDPRGLEHDAASRQDLRERGDRAGAVLRERRGLRDVVRGQEGEVPGPEGPHPPQDVGDAMSAVHETVVMEGHLIDSDQLRRAFNRIVEDGGEFEVLDFRVGKTNADPSRATLSVAAPDPHVLDRILESLAYLGAAPHAGGDASFAPAEADGILPDEF